MVTDEMIERAAAAMFSHGDEGMWEALSKNRREFWRSYAREALEAALSAAEPTSQRMAGEDDAIDAMVLSLRDPFPSESLMRAGGIDYWRDIMRSAYRSALSAQVQDVAGWRPIETAPKDGSSVLGFWSYTYLGDKEPTTGIEIIEWHDGKFHGWKDRDGVTQDGVYTHWMLLPEAPAAPAKQEG